MCPHCKTEQCYDTILKYSYSHLYYLFGFVTEKKYSVVCRSCKTATAVATKDVESQIGKEHIPFTQRQGMGFLVGLIGLVVILGVIFN